jgi:hypothetical protein
MNITFSIVFVLLYITQTLYAGHGSSDAYELCQSNSRAISEAMSYDFGRENDYSDNIAMQSVQHETLYLTPNMQYMDSKANDNWHNCLPSIDSQAIMDEERGSYYASQLMHTDYEACAIKDTIDRELLQISSQLNRDSTISNQLDALERLQELATSFDRYCQDLHHQQNSFIDKTDPIMIGKICGAEHLRTELHNVLNGIKIDFFDKIGNLRKAPDCKDIKVQVSKYHNRYKSGPIKIEAAPNFQRLERAEQNRPYIAMKGITACWKQGDLKAAHKIAEQFAKDKSSRKMLQDLKASSKHLNEYGMPKIWESHPNWAAYKQELIAHPGKRDAIIQVLQHDHNKAYELCNRSGIKMPTATQLNYAHQLGQYHKDPLFMDIASRGLQDKASFEKAIRMFDQRAYVLGQIQDIALRYPDSMPLLQQRMDKLVLCSHDPEFLSMLNEMASDPGKIDVLCKDLLSRDLYVHELRKQLGYPFFTEHTQELAYQLAGAKNNAERIELLHNVCTNYNDDVYLAFHDTKTHLPKLFNYDQQLLKTELPACFWTQEFAQERKLYTQVMMQPLTCHEQFLQAQQCVSFFKDACVPQENQTVYRDLARTAAQTYLNQSYNITPVDRMQQVELFDRACRAIERGDITQADIPVQAPQVIERTYEHNAHVDYKQLHENVLEKCATHQSSAFADYYQSREHALKQIVDGNGALYKQTYELSPQAEKILEKNGFDLVQFTTCTGNLLQQDTHAKFVQTLNTLAQKPVLTGATQQIKEGVLECAQAGSQLNQNGNVKEAMILSDFCHVAVEYLWQGIDASIAVSKGVAEGVYVGVSSEIAKTFRDPHALQETFLTEGSWTEPDLRDRVVMETATIVSDLVRLVKDSGEVVFSGARGVGDAIVGLPELVNNCIEVTKVTGQCLGYVAEEIVWLLDAAERKDVVAFQRQSEKMQQECALVAQSIGEYLSQLKECKHNYNGQITKEDLKEFARFGGRFVAEGVILSNALRGCTKILKGAAQYAKSTESALVQLRHMKDVSVAQARGLLLKEEIYASTPVGRPGSFLNVVTKNKPEIINGIKFTGHALDRMQERGILSPSVILDIVKNPSTAYPGNRPDTYVYVRDNLKVITNVAGDILTVIPQ